MGKAGSPKHFDPPELRQLIASARKGDERAFTRLVRMHEDLVFRFASKLCRDQEKADEVFQDTFVSVHRGLPRFDGRSKFSSWLYTIVSNHCLMKLRRSKLVRASLSIDAPFGFTDDPPRDGAGHFLQTLPSWKETPLDGVVRKELRDRLDGAIEGLPPDHRVVFVLRDVEDRSAAETAKILGLSVAAVKSRLHRARRYLREQLDGYMRT